MASLREPRFLEERRAFLRSLSAPARLALIAAIFCTFAPLGLIFLMARGGAESLTSTLLWALMCGAIALGWAFSFLWSIKLLFVTLIAQFALPMALGALGLMDSPASRQGFEGMTAFQGFLSILLIVSGYALFVMFIRTEAEAKLRLSTEMALAGRIHKSLVPEISVKTPQVEVFGVSDASAEMGGDLIDIVEGPQGVDVYLADVSGHGVRAGVLMAMVKSSIRTRLISSDGPGGPASLADVVTDLNRIVAALAEPDMFVTFACLRMREGGAVEYVLAGHHPILLVRTSTGSLEELPNESLPLGVDKRETFRAGEVAARPGDLFALTTDGLFEVKGQGGAQLGRNAIERVIVEHARRPLREVLTMVIHTARAHGPQDDDQTLVLARVL